MKKRNAFTLVELLVVIGIIALLISMLIPVLNKVKENANTVKCASQMRQLVTAILMYAGDNKSNFPWPPQIGEVYVANDPNPLMYYMVDTSQYPYGVIRYDAGVYFPYVSRSKAAIGSTGSEVVRALMNCPSDNDVNRNAALNGNHGVPRNFTYSWNVLIRSNYNMPNGVTGDPYDIAGKTTQIRDSANKAILIEESSPNDGVAWISIQDGDDTPAFYHNKRCNLGFADGHAETLTPTQIGYSEVQNNTQRATIANQRRVDYYFKPTKR